MIFKRSFKKESSQERRGERGQEVRSEEPGLETAGDMGWRPGRGGHSGTSGRGGAGEGRSCWVSRRHATREKSELLLDEQKTAAKGR